MMSKSILLVDDDTDLLQALSARCQTMGLSVLHARNLLTATITLEKCVPDVICVDVNMPTGNGLRFCEMLSRDPRQCGTQVIVLTGSRDEETVSTCSRLGVHYLCKSADVWTKLEPLLSRLLARSGYVDGKTTSSPACSPRAHTISRRLEKVDAAADGKPLRGERQLASAVEQCRVLVADDDADLVTMLCERLSTLGCTAIGVNSSLDAVNEIHRLQPQLVILDVNMPTGSGLSICEMLVTDETKPNIPVIILSGAADERTIRRCHDMLVFYVQKSADVWRRVEPLVRELLHLNEPEEAAMGLPHARHANRQARQDKKQKRDTLTADTGQATGGSPHLACNQLIGDRRDDSLAEAVFAMLGPAEVTEVVAISPDPLFARVETPWILCIDDDNDFSEALKLRLDEYGVAVSRAASGMAGYWMAYTTQAAAILLDYQMPDGKGDYILRRLMDNPMTRGIPVIMITGVRDKMLERRVMAMGAKAFLVKPVSIDRLCKLLSEFIPKLQQTKNLRLEFVAER